MARQRSPDSINAEKEYIESNGEVKLKDLANKFKVSPGTVRSWKNRYNWDDKINSNNNATLQKEKKKKRNVANKKNVEKPKHFKVVEALEVESNELTEKQKLFCLYYVKYWNATKAYKKAYDCTYLTARVEGSRNLTKPNIKNEIDKLKESIRKGIGLEAMAVFQKYIDIAFADITDYVSFGREEIIVGNDDNGNPIKREFNVVNLKESFEVDGTILSEVSQGKNGVKVKLLDKMKALQWLSDRIDLLSKETAHKIKIEEEKLEILKEKSKNETDNNKQLINEHAERVKKAWENR